MSAQQLISEGKPGAALSALQDLVRKDASNAKNRVFLFQLLSVLGQWNRALTQLNVAGELDAGTLSMVQTYREAIQCEALRADIFSGKTAPLIFGEPPQWLALMLEALKQEQAGHFDQAAATRASALEDAPAVTGTINGEAFNWIADTDVRLGPVLEAIVNGRYFWIPFERISRIELEAPTDLRDKVWTAAHFTWSNGAQTVGLIPTRYQGTVAHADEALMMARGTDWNEAGHGLGQRMFATDAGDYALLDLRVVELDTAEPPAAEEPAAPETDDSNG